MTPASPLRVIVAVKVPFAFPSLPFGFGRSCDARSAAFTDALIATWSRISPAGFVGGWAFSAARAFSIAASAVWSMGAVPVTPLEQGAHNGTRTGPDDP